MNAKTRASIWWPGMAVAGALLIGPGHVLADSVLAAQVDEPRAYGWRVGDLVHRVVHLQLPAGWQLDERSLPKPDQRGGELELRSLRLVVDDRPRSGDSDDAGESIAATDLVAGGALSGDSAEHDEIGLASKAGTAGGPPERSATGWRDVLAQGWAGTATAVGHRVRAVWRQIRAGADAAAPAPALRQATRQRLELDYQLFAATSTPRKLELPTITLIAEPPAGLVGATPRELRLPARPLWLVSLAGGAPGNQSGLGEMRPDVAVQGMVTAAPARQLMTSLLVAAALLLLAIGADALLRWLGVSVRTQPFNQASREIRRLLGRAAGTSAGRGLAPAGDNHEAAWRVLHQAFNRSAGRTLLPRQARTWALGDARFAPLAGEIDRFFVASSERFFAVGEVGQTGASGASRRRPAGELARAGGAVQDEAANDDLGFDEARLMQLAKALARAETAGLAGQGMREARSWGGRRVTGRAEPGQSTAAAGKSGGLGSSGQGARQPAMPVHK